MGIVGVGKGWGLLRRLYINVVYNLSSKDRMITFGTHIAMHSVDVLKVFWWEGVYKGVGVGQTT